MQEQIASWFPGFLIGDIPVAANDASETPRRMSA